MTEYLDTLISVWPSWALLTTLVVSILILGKAADVLVEDAVAISRQWRLPSAVVGATIVSLGTTTPEAVVSVLAAVQGRSDLALGNAVGSIICDTGLILGIGCLISPLRFDRGVVNQQSWVKVATGVLLVLACVPWLTTGPLQVFSSGGTLPQVVGWGFLVLLALYMRWSVQLARQSVGEDDQDIPDALRGRARTVFSLAVAIAVVVVSASFLISSATESAVRLDVPPSVIAATLVAFGTSLPELVIVITATLKGETEIAIGNVIGADILNVLFVAGAAASVTPTGLEADPHFFILQFPAMLFLLAIFRFGTLMTKNSTLTRPFGVVLLGTYVVVTVASYLLS
ncbi:MAG: sodium:calcium antiporter [Vicinamibacterales bacterium]